MHVYPFYLLPGKTLYPRVLSMRPYPNVTARFTRSVFSAMVIILINPVYEHPMAKATKQTNRSRTG
eukprot:scaffold55666_cov43-Cyclotella_meneghiniana.AAC.3